MLSKGGKAWHPAWMLQGDGGKKQKQWWLSTDWTWNTCKKCTTRPLWKFTQVSGVLTMFYCTHTLTHTHTPHTHTHTPHTHTPHTYPIDPMMLFVSARKPNIKVHEQQVNGKWEAKKEKKRWLSNSADCVCIKNAQCTHFENVPRFLVHSHSHSNVLLHTHKSNWPRQCLYGNLIPRWMKHRWMENG